MSSGSPSIQSSDGMMANPSSEEASKALSQLMKDLTEDPTKQKNKTSLYKEEAKQYDTSKPLSVLSLDSKSSPKDIADRYTEKLANSSLIQAQLQTSADLKAQAQTMVGQVLKQGLHEKNMDTALLSQAGATIGHQSDPAVQKTKRSETDIFLDFLDEKSTKDQPTTTLSQASKIGLDANKSQPLFLAEDKQAIRQALHQYMSSYADSLITRSPKKKQEATTQHDTLKTLSIPPQVVHNIRNNVQRMVQKDMRQKVKQGFLEFAMSYSSKGIDLSVIGQNKKFKALESLAKEMGAIGEDSSELNDLKSQARGELSTMVANELDKTMVSAQTQSSSATDLMKAFDQFNDLVGVAKFDSGSYMKQFRKKMEDYGLTYFASPVAQGQLDTESGSSGQKNKQPFEYETEIEAVEDKLRTALMRSYTSSGDLKTSIQNRLDILKCKRKLGEIGDPSAQRMQDIQAEAESLAKIKLMDLLKESFEERATLLDHKGPSYLLIRKKMKMALSGLKKLEVRVSKDAITHLKHQVNKNIFGVLREEFLKIDAYATSNPTNKGLKQKRNDYLTILERLKSESSIQEDIYPSMFQKTTPEQTENHIVEAA